MEDHYRTLGVGPNASQKEIKKRFRELARSYHPDKFSTSIHQKQAEEIFKRINEAYQVLSHQQSRTEYDRQRFALIHQQEVAQRRAEEAIMARRRREEEAQAVRRQGAHYRGQKETTREAPSWGSWQIAAVFSVSLIGSLLVLQVSLSIAELYGGFVLAGLVVLCLVLAVLFTQPWKIS